MDQQFMQQQAERIKQAMAEWQESLRDLREDGLGRSFQETTSELSLYDNHPADVASELYEREKELGIQDNFEVLLSKGERALQAIAAGNYGICEFCGATIPRERLEAMPWATACLRCQRHQEQLGTKRHPRPIEEDVVVPPLAMQSHDTNFRELGDAEDEQMFDGEDAMQALYRWNEHSDAAGAGSYTGGLDFDENAGYTEDVDHIPYDREDGVIWGQTPGDEE
ncbi:MAG: TraR/DksA C4-type zinc finger protein [Bacillota bacterium]|uniref:Transcriptional regulator, TraR/DksA family n=2 Tax=Carboxydocella TaxID=178898 RepID=A0A1T4NME6_9FIRM|nr:MULTISPECIES: TraR/DksA C4-type zinc finger protein [Carboxydocella]AVX20109.1 transcriptional regulator, TraR/DksA family [Carboxydocella thermautotrophica]AVX30526.1 transcriptional regulator, TraR/DksA family [Carboxydocella thermautotrophica]SJZ80440.1 transcriptional regulator, TraR/DksA family [Carboxydocella sporoproducens DSM 16521]GAW28466.1 hypothetical protein ULO1_10360 [Carboxydocella sp. ULO1]GAW31756.1 hypothetical protein JDF658_15210 [Carboxydocella sp. JDF658]